MNKSFSADPDRLKKWVDILAGQIGPRPFSAPAKLKKVADTLRAHLSDLGYSVLFQEFTYRGERYFNVVASPQGEDPMGRVPWPVLVVGAHYDTVSSTPGADDNASAVAGLMELAGMLAASHPRGLRLVAFCLEEPPVFRTRNIGSYHYASYLKGTGQPVTGMICLEMIGYFSERPNSQRFPFPFMKRMFPTTGNFIALVGNNKSRNFTLRIKELFSKGTSMPAVSLNAPAIVVGIDLSDHWSFNRHRIPAVMVTDTAFYRNPHYHRPSDLPYTLDYQKSAQVVDGVASAVLGITGDVQGQSKN